MNIFDMVIVVILCFGMIRGIFRGLIKEMASIVGVLAGFYFSYTYYTTIKLPIITGFVSDPAYLNIIHFMIIFCTVFLIISILGVMIKYIMNIVFLGWVDRICGFGFGFIKGVLIISVLLIVLTAFLPPGSPLIQDSRLSPQVTKLSENMAKVISLDMKRDFETKIDDLKRTWEKSKS